MTFENITCTPATPADPTVSLATCANGAVAVPTVGLPTTTGVTYVVDPSGPYDGTQDTTVTVTATVADGFEWGAAAGRLDV